MDGSKFDSSGSIRGILLLFGIGFLCETCFAFETALEKTKLDTHDTHDIDIYIEQKLGYVHAKIDLTPTINGLMTLEKCIYRLDKGTSDTLGSVLSIGLRKRLERIETKIMRVSGKKYLSEKQKRSIEIVGNLISELFGNPGPSDWKKNTANVLALQNALKRLNDESVAFHMDIDMSRHNIELNNNVIRSLSISVTKNQLALTSISDEMTSLKIFFEITQLADAIESQVDYLVEVKADSLKGFCNDRAIDKDFLIENLQNMEANQVGLSPVFSSWEWRDYYKHAMCSAALDNDAVWITMRIPFVKKAEKLVRVIPFPALRESILKVESYGLDTVLFRERNNDKYHIMTSSSLDFCTNLGKIRSCSVRDVRFGLVGDTVIPVEFALNRFLLVSNKPQPVKLMGRCPNGIIEHTLVTDAVLLVPVNCSYIGKTISINIRESDTAITREVGIVHFDKLEINPVHNLHLNLSHTEFVSISNSTSHLNFESSKKFIDEQLRAIDTKHDSLWTQYSLEKWALISVLGGVGILVAICKLIGWNKTRSKPEETKIEMQSNFCKITHDKDNRDTDNLDNLDRQPFQQQQLQIQQQQTQQLQLHKHEQHVQRPEPQVQLASGVVLNTEHVYTEVSNANLSFGLPPETSQFYEKCPTK